MHPPGDFFTVKEMQSNFLYSKKARKLPLHRPDKKARKTVSRVLSWMIIYPGRMLPHGSSGPPERTPGERISFCLALLRMGFTYAPAVTGRAVVSYTAVSPLPPGACTPGGCFFSVALSLESPPPDVIRHPALWSPDFPRGAEAPRDHPSFLRFSILGSSSRPQIHVRWNSWEGPRCSPRENTRGI